MNVIASVRAYNLWINFDFAVIVNGFNVTTIKRNIPLFGPPFVKRFALSDRCPVLSCPLCLHGVLWPNGYVWIKMKLGSEVGLGPGHSILDGDPAPAKGAQPQFLAYVHCGQTAACIKMPLGTEVGLGPGHIVLDGDAAVSKRGTVPNFRPMSIVAKRSAISTTAEHFLHNI